MYMQVGARSGKRTYTGYIDNNISYSATETSEAWCIFNKL